MRRYPKGSLKAEDDYDREKAREAGMRFDTAPEPEAPWKGELKKISAVLDADLTASRVILPE